MTETKTSTDNEQTPTVVADDSVVSSTTQPASTSTSTTTKSTQGNRKLWVGLTMIGLGLLIAIGITYGVVKLFDKEETPVVEEPVKKRIRPETNAIPVSERPVIFVIPASDGNNLELIIDHLNKPALEVEYDIDWQAGTTVQGEKNILELSSLPIRKKVFMGSCSAGGACTYHQDIKGGNIVSFFFGGQEDYVVKNNWRYFDNSAKEDTVSSRDAKFSVTSDGLKNTRYLIVTNSPGHPADIPGELISDVYVLQSSSPIRGDLNVSIRANEEGGGKIVAWNGSKWLTLDTTPDADDTKTLTATTADGWLFAVVR